jgi:hypothetical protein
MTINYTLHFTNATKKEDNMGLPEAMLSASMSGIKDELYKNLDAAVEAAQKALDKAAAEYDEAVKVRDTVKEALGEVKRGALYYLPSRTGDTSGHFIEGKSVSGKVEYTCKCPAGRYGNVCWAVRWARDHSYKLSEYGYVGSLDKFDRLVKPTGMGYLKPQDSWRY